MLGWVPRQELRPTLVSWSIRVSVSRHPLVLRHGTRIVRSARVAVGASPTLTPTGRYVITDHIDPGAERITYGCCILAFSRVAR